MRSATDFDATSKSKRRQGQQCHFHCFGFRHGAAELSMAIQCRRHSVRHQLQSCAHECPDYRCRKLCGAGNQFRWGNYERYRGSFRPVTARHYQQPRQLQQCCWFDRLLLRRRDRKRTTDLPVAQKWVQPDQWRKNLRRYFKYSHHNQPSTL